MAWLKGARLKLNYSKNQHNLNKTVILNCYNPAELVVGVIMTSKEYLIKANQTKSLTTAAVIAGIITPEQASKIELLVEQAEHHADIIPVKK